MSVKVIAQEGILKGVISTSKNLKAKLSTSLPDDGYEKGYEEGYLKGEERGYETGYSKGKTDGLAARTYETWTITLTDGTVIEKEVALL